MYGDRKPFEKGPIEIGKQDPADYSTQEGRMNDILNKAVVANIGSKGRRPSPEVAMHHVTAIHAVAAVKNGQGSAYDVLGGVGVVDQVHTEYPIEMSLSQKAQKLMRSAGNQQQMNDILDNHEGKGGRAEAATILKDLKNRITNGLPRNF